jgi:hypothetical protein
MLYPNFDDFVSLSTNHIEVGSHVKSRSKEKKDQFLLPLMTLPDLEGKPSIGLLDLPAGTMPSWNSLPVLNLTGSLTTLGAITQAGLLRKEELRLHECSNVPSFLPHSVRDLACIDDRH